MLVQSTTILKSTNNCSNVAVHSCVTTPATRCALTIMYGALTLTELKLLAILVLL